MKPLILFDFDRTLFDTDSLKATQSQMIASITGIPLADVEQSMLDYVKTLESHLDFTPEGYAKHLEQKWGIDPGSVLKIYFTDTNYIGNYLFDDVMEVLKELSSRFTLGILTQSQPNHQRVKIERTGILEYIDQSFYTIVPRKKDPTLLQSLLPGTLFIDDDKEVIAAFLTYASQVKVLWINRKNSEIHPHAVTINSLRDLLTRNLV